MYESIIQRDLDALIDDRVSDGMFRVDRAVYTDEAIFEQEVSRIFENCWWFLCHESQVANHGDYFWTDIGDQPVFVHRQEDGSLKCFINACSHRAAILTPFKQGNAKTLTCRFHGWTYKCDGACIGVKNEEEGTEKGKFDLREIARLESYKGFVFGCLNSNICSLEDWLGAAKPWIDLMVVQSPEGLEVVPGSSTYKTDGNWKLQAENSVDGYHVSTVHRVFAHTIAARESKGEYTGIKKTESGRIAGGVPTAGYSLGNGHMSIWAQHTTPEVRPIWEAKDRLEKELSPIEVEWILTKGRNLYLFPNVMLMDNPSTQIRVMKPVSANRVDITVYCVAPKGESDKARAGRLRKFEDFYLTAGMATSDDIAALEDTHEGSMARDAKWSEFKRGIRTFTRGADDDAKALGFEPEVSSDNWDHEVLYHGFYRHWLKMMKGEQAG
ncbi:MAG: benzoate 1,2-dioxygenase large subunit [Rhodospirillaceae bacterium]|nr:benzoate 1,2-dioxygenase large subunit [Rhodospirillaceae bacterium]|tara:strand:- start:657 stop:1976 length:1320 start_codon:yes stop_codon:yes gene_type:complete